MRPATTTPLATSRMGAVLARSLSAPIGSKPGARPRSATCPDDTRPREVGSSAPGTCREAPAGTSEYLFILFFSSKFIIYAVKARVYIITILSDIEGLHIHIV